MGVLSGHALPKKVWPWQVLLSRSHGQPPNSHFKNGKNKRKSLFSICHMLTVNAIHQYPVDQLQGSVRIGPKHHWAEFLYLKHHIFIANVDTLHRLVASHNCLLYITVELLQTTWTTVLIKSNVHLILNFPVAILGKGGHFYTLPTYCTGTIRNHELNVRYFWSKL